MAIRDWPNDERPREKLLEKGATALSDAMGVLVLLLLSALFVPQVRRRIAVNQSS